MSAPTVTAALKQLEATEANLAKLERLCDEIYKPIQSGIRFGSNADYEDRCRLVTEILKQPPKIDDWRLRVASMVSRDTNDQT